MGKSVFGTKYTSKTRRLQILNEINGLFPSFQQHHCVWSRFEYEISLSLQDRSLDIALTLSQNQSERPCISLTLPRLVHDEEGPWCGQESKEEQNYNQLVPWKVHKVEYNKHLYLHRDQLLILFVLLLDHHLQVNLFLRYRIWERHQFFLS